MRLNERNSIFLIIFLILGVVISFQVKGTKVINSQKDEKVFKDEQLKALIADERNRGKELKKLINENERKKEDYVKLASSIKNDNNLSSEHIYLDSIKVKAGLTDVKGPGVIIELNDALPNKDDDPNNLKDKVIHDAYIVGILNELKKFGVQAISINDERIISTSEQVCAGPTIRINKSRYPAPFKIKAIGNSNIMYENLSNSDIVNEIIQRYNIRLKITKSQDLMIYKYNKKLDNLLSGLEVVP